jgi:hypothetical protein
LESEESIHLKLVRIAEIWNEIESPVEWRNFIYYLPITNNETSGEKALYERFLEYYNKNKFQILDEMQNL